MCKRILEEGFVELEFGKNHQNVNPHLNPTHGVNSSTSAAPNPSSSS